MTRYVTRGIFPKQERIGGDFIDVGVVADDSRQRSLEKCISLLLGKHAFSFPPEPEKITQSDLLQTLMSEVVFGNT